CRCTGISLPGSISAAPKVSCADPSDASKKIARRTPGTTSPSGLSARLVTRIGSSPDTLRRGDTRFGRLWRGSRGNSGKEPLGSRDANAELDRLAGIEQRELGPRKSRQDLKLVQRSEVADAEHAAAKLTETHAEREIQPLGRHFHNRSWIDRVNDDGRERIRRAGGVTCEHLQPPRADRLARRLGKARMPRENVVEAFLEQHPES